MSQTFAVIAPVQLIFHIVSCSKEMIPNAPKHYETHQTHEFRGLSDEIGALVANNSDTTSWHELLC